MGGAVPSLSLSFMKAAALTVSKNEVESKLSVVPALRAQQALDAAVKLFLPVNDGLSLVRRRLLDRQSGAGCLGGQVGRGAAATRQDGSAVAVVVVGKAGRQGGRRWVSS
jgi:hypothetical protein